MKKHDEDLNKTPIFVGHLYPLLRRIYADLGPRPVCSLPSPRPSSSRSTLYSSQTQPFDYVMESLPVITLTHSHRSPGLPIYSSDMRFIRSDTGIQTFSTQSYASKSGHSTSRSNWDRFTRHLSASEMFIYASPRAAVLAGPYAHWQRESSDVDVEDLISKWVTAIPTAPYTEEVAGSVIGALLQIAANRRSRLFIPADLWLWLNERPFLPPTYNSLL